MLKVYRVCTQFLGKQLTVRTITVGNKNAPHKFREQVQTNFKRERDEKIILSQKRRKLQHSPPPNRPVTSRRRRGTPAFSIKRDSRRPLRNCRR